MKIHIVNINTTKWTTLAKYSSKALREGTLTYIYHDGINFSRDLIRAVQAPSDEMVVLCGRENHMNNALRIAQKFQQVFPTITQLETVI